MQSCCQKEHSNLNSLWYRSVIMSGIGLLMMVPLVESMILHASFTLPAMGALFSYMLWVLYSDFSKEMGRFIATLFAISGIILSPVYLSGSLLAVTFSMSTAMLAGILFFQLPGHGENHSLLTIPSTDRIVVFLAAMSSVLSIMHIWMPFIDAGHMMLHEAFIALGAVNLGAYYQTKHRTHLHGHNFKQEVYHSEMKKNVQINDLKKGDVIKINSPTVLPMSFNLVSGMARQDEKLIKTPGMFPADSEVLYGQIEVLESYHRSHGNNEFEEQSMANHFLLMILLIGAVSGLYYGLSAGLLLEGVKYFIINMTVCCPCVFLIASPKLKQTLFEWAEQHNIASNKSPKCNEIDTYVFDRTGTLYHPDPDNLAGRYVINKQSLDLLKSLKAKGKEIFILSGHNDKENLENCRDQLKDYVRPGNILFDKHYHKLGTKNIFISNLQSKGKKVCMVGDGNNDAKALSQADLGIGVRQTQDDCIQSVVDHANFIVKPSQLKMIPDIVTQATKVQSLVNQFTMAAGLYHLLMLGLVNGGYLMMFSASFPEMLGCVMMSAFCISLQFFVEAARSNLIKHKPLDAKGSQEIITPCRKSCCQKNILSGLLCPEIPRRTVDVN